MKKTLLHDLLMAPNHEESAYVILFSHCIQTLRGTVSMATGDGFVFLNSTCCDSWCSQAARSAPGAGKRQSIRLLFSICALHESAWGWKKSVFIFRHGNYTKYSGCGISHWASVASALWATLWTQPHTVYMLYYNINDILYILHIGLHSPK